MFRAFARFGSVLFLMVSLAAGIGFTLAWRRGGALRAAASALLLVAAFELSPTSWRWHWALPTEAHRWLQEEPVAGTVLDCIPVSTTAIASRYLMQTRLTFLDRGVEDCAEPGLAGKLAWMGVGYLLVRSEDPLNGVVARPGIEPVRAFGDSTLWRVTAPPADLYVRRTSGFSWRETDGATSWRWMGRRGRLELENVSDSTLRLDLKMSLSSFHQPRVVLVGLDRREVARVEVRTEATEVVVSDLEITPGVHQLLLLPSGEAVSPTEVAGSSDDRPLTVALGDWSWVPAAESGRSGTDAIEDHQGSVETLAAVELDASLEAP